VTNFKYSSDSGRKAIGSVCASARTPDSLRRVHVDRVRLRPHLWDLDSTGPSAAIGAEGKGVWWYLDGAKRYKAGDYPKQQFSWFDKTGAVLKFDAYPDELVALSAA